jgi:putative ABC transport system permease protein
MNTPLLLESIVKRLGRYKVKTVLICVGIIVSVAVTVLVQTVAGSFRDAMRKFIDRSYPSDSILLAAGGGTFGGGTGRDALRLSDVETVVNSIGEIRSWTPLADFGERDLKNNGHSKRVTVLGVSQEDPVAERRDVQTGESFTATEVLALTHVAVIGRTTARELFPGESPLGQSLIIDNVPYRIKGILEPFGVDPHGDDQDNIVHIPYTLLHNNYVRGARYRIGDAERVPSVTLRLTQLIRDLHNLREGQPNDFRVLTAVSANEILRRMYNTISIFIRFIAVTAFLISGLVLLNIMLANARERKAEIGLRNALGARPSDIKVQFIYEALIVSVVACAIGLLLAFGCLHILEPVIWKNFGIRHLTVSLVVIAVSVGASTLTGMAGGLLPAIRASKLKPVDALR